MSHQSHGNVKMAMENDENDGNDASVMSGNVNENDGNCGKIDLCDV